MTDTDLDRWIALKIMRWRRATNHWVKGNTLQYAFDSWNPTKSHDQAFQVVEKMDDCLHLSEHGKNGIWAAMFCTYGHEWVSAKTPALAICLAAKAAIEGVE